MNSSMNKTKWILMLSALASTFLLVIYSFCVVGTYDPPSDNQKNIAFLKTVFGEIEEAVFFYSEASWVHVVSGGMGGKVKTENPVYECISTKEYGDPVVFYRFNRFVPPDSPINMPSHVESIRIFPLKRIYIMVERVIASVYSTVVLLALFAGIATWCMLYWRRCEGCKMAFDEKKPCKACGVEISSFSTHCPKCGVSQNEDGE